MSWTPKDPASIEYFRFDFAMLLEINDLVSSVVGVTIDSGDTALVIGSPTLAGSVVTALIGGGTLGTTYKLRAEVLTGASDRLELSGNLLIRRGAY